MSGDVKTKEELAAEVRKNLKWIKEFRAMQKWQRENQ